MGKLKLTAIALGLAIAGTAAADPFYLNAGVYGTTESPADADTRTNDLASLGWTDSVATSIYLGLTPGSTVIDTNDATILGSYGISAVISPDQRLIENLNSVLTLGDAEGFTSTPDEWGDAFRGGTRWGMTYTYTLNGTINAAGTGVDFTSGYFDLFHEDGTNTTQVIRLNLDSFSLVGGSEALYTVLSRGYITYDWAVAPSAFVQNFFVDVESGKNFYELWQNGDAINPLAVSWRMDNNIDCPINEPNCSGIPLPGQLTPIVKGQEVIGGYRRTTVDGTVRFAVPEPGSLALLGLGLAGLGLSLRRRKAA